MCVPLSAYLNSQFGTTLPLALTTALASVSWPQAVSFNLGIMNPSGSINALPLVQELELGSTGGGTFWDMTACAAQIQVTATIVLPSVTMTLAAPAVLSMALSGTLTAWAQATPGGGTALVALTATSLGLGANPFAGGQSVVAAINSDPASTSLATLLTPLLQSGLATSLANQVLAAVLPLPIAVGSFSLCASSAPAPATSAASVALSKRTLGQASGRSPFYHLAAPPLSDPTPLLNALATYLQSQLNGGLWAAVAGSVGFTLGGNPSKIDPLNLSGVVSGYGGGGSCGADCIAGTNSYGNGAGSCPCPGGYTDMGLTCYRPWLPDSISCQCQAGQYMYGALCYPNCEVGYAPVGCCVCAQQVQVCAGGVGGFQMGNLTGLAGLTFGTFSLTAAPSMNVITAVANVSGTVTLAGGSAWGSAAVFEVPCGEGDNWQAYIPHQIAVDFPAMSVGITATVTITVPWAAAGASTQLQFGSASTIISNISVDAWDWGFILSSVPGLSELASTVNGQISSALNGAVASAVPQGLLASLGTVTLPFPMA